MLVEYKLELMDENYIRSDRKLYICTGDLKKAPAINIEYATNMISMITRETTQSEFEAAWIKNPDYKLEMRDACFETTALHGAVITNNLALTIFIIKKLDVNNIDLFDGKHTPLLEAVFSRFFWKYQDETSLKIIEHLLVAGANANLAKENAFRDDGFNKTALTDAFENKDFKLTKLLLNYGAKKLCAISKGELGIVKQKLTNDEDELYKKAKKEIKDTQFLFFIFAKEILMPQEVCAHILTCARVESLNKQRVDEAQTRLITVEIPQHLAEVNDFLVNFANEY